jgi:uncharacterized protein GlcG (DUF336 family)
MRTESSRQFRDSYVAENDQAKISQLSSMVTIASNNGGMAPFPGGVLLDKNIKHIITGEKVRSIFGAIGVSGAKGAEDEICAIAGLEYFKSVENGLKESD